MKTINTFGVHFVIRGKKSDSENYTIYARITIDKHRFEISLKQKIADTNWNSARGMAKGKSSEMAELNSLLEKTRAQFVNCYHQLVLEKQKITPDAIKKKYYGIEESEQTLMNLIKYHNDRMDENLEWGTQKNYFTTEKYVSLFLKEKLCRNDIPLSELNFRFISDFEYFMRKLKRTDHIKPMGNNTIMKHIERLRKMINLSVKMEWIEKDPFTAHKAKFIKVQRGYLSQEELELIEQKDFSIERLQQVKDLFVFSCYTGLAYIDAINLKSADIRKGIDGGEWIFTARQKTDVSVQIPLLSKASKIIAKYKDHPKTKFSGTVFPGISNQKLNSYLKEIADLCGINKNLTFHLARHTFATTVTLTNGVPIESVSKMLGHSDIRTTQIYAKVVEMKISEDMTKLQNKLQSVAKLAN